MDFISRILVIGPSLYMCIYLYICMYIYIHTFFSLFIDDAQHDVYLKIGPSRNGATALGQGMLGAKRGMLGAKRRGS